MRAAIGAVLVLGAIGVFAFGTLTWLEPRADPADLAALEQLAQAHPEWPQAAFAEHVAQRRAHATAYRVVQIGAALLMGLTALTLGGVVRRWRGAMPLALGTAAIAIGLVVFSPDFAMGLYGPPPPRDLALLCGLPAMVVSACSLLLRPRHGEVEARVAT